MSEGPSQKTVGLTLQRVVEYHPCLLLDGIPATIESHEPPQCWQRVPELFHERARGSASYAVRNGLEHIALGGLEVIEVHFVRREVHELLHVYDVQREQHVTVKLAARL